MHPNNNDLGGVGWGGVGGQCHICSSHKFQVGNYTSQDFTLTSHSVKLFFELGNISGHQMIFSCR